MEFIPLVQMAALVFAIINFLKAVRNKDTNNAVTQAIVWISGVVVIMLAAQTDFADGVIIGDQTLASLNFWSLLFIGLTISSLASFGVEIKKALDVSDSAATMPLIVTDPEPHHPGIDPPPPR